jgi:hypothetical protein
MVPKSVETAGWVAVAVVVILFVALFAIVKFKEGQNK